jgi:DNA polymerase-3 subunit alpha
LQERLKLEVPVLVRASVRVEEGANPKLMVSDISPLEEAKPKLPASLRLKIPLESTTNEVIDELHGILAAHKGEARVLFDLERPGDFMVIMEAEGYNVMPDHAFISRVEELCGRGSVRVVE